MPVYEVQSPDGRTFEVTAPDGATQAEILAYAQKNYSQQPKGIEPTAPTKPKTLMGSAGDLLAGGVRGAGSIGATILAPFDMAKDAIAGKGLSLESNRQRRVGMDGGLRELGADTESGAYSVGKLGGEIAGTAGMGGVLAKPVQALAASRFGSGIEPILNGVATGLKTGGFRVGELAGTGAGTAARLGAGAAVGGASAGLVNPTDAGSGALIGGALPGATALAGRAGSAVRNATGGNISAVTPEAAASAREAIQAGYVIPPATVNPTWMNRTLETTSGKMATQQLASVQNAERSRELVKQALGLADDVPLNRQTLEGIRKDAGKAYKALADLPPAPAQRGSTLMNTKAVEAIKPGQLIEDLKQARNDSQTWFKSYNASANPEHLAKAKQADALASSIENTLEKYAESRGATDLLPALRDARKRIAQTYTVERALNEATGSIDATVLGKLFKKGKPLSGGLEQVGRFGSAFPTVAKLPERIGSPDAHNLRSVASMGLGAVGGVGAGPLGLLAAGIPYAAPPLARSIMFSRPMQRGLLNVPNAADDSLGLLTSGAYRALPLLSGQ
jgi:hypothetical protein